ncbi:hypothetical protein [Amycolatopsis sp. NPDC021455]|uniref:hypothetical protein n=1 Tax=Amycolatopsis sp. NPDC021455 TaxID=3154901 RepID=UPI0033D31858
MGFGVNDFGVSVDGESLYLLEEATGAMTVTATAHGYTAENGYTADTTPGFCCAACKEPLRAVAVEGYDEPDYLDRDDKPECPRNPDVVDADAIYGPHTPEPHPLIWLRNASIELDADADAVTVTIETNDPGNAIRVRIANVVDDRENEPAGHLVTTLLPARA